MNWTDERVEKLKKLWSEGLSASQIAAQLGGVSRNAVIGKVHRLSLPGRAKAGGTTAAARPKRATSAPRAPNYAARAVTRTVTRTAGATVLKEEVAVDLVAEQDLVLDTNIVVPMSRRLELTQLTERTCKWPIGDPATEDFWFCGLQSLPGKPYCEAHVGVAFQPMSARRDRRR